MKTAWILFLRDWRAGELRLAALALVLAVASVTTVGFVQDRVAAALVVGAARLTAGDLVLASDQPPALADFAEATRLGLASSVSAGFSSMLRSHDRSVLVSVKAVAANFPLRGTLRITPAGGGPPVARTGPPKGQAYIASGLAARLGLQPGEPLSLGKLDLTVAGVIADEPDGGMGTFRIAPRVMISDEDLDATGLIRAGSRVNWRLAVAGAPGALARWREAVQSRALPGERIESAVESRPEVRSVIDQSGEFLRLSSLASVLLASVALFFALRRHVERQRPVAAIQRCLGASSRQVWQRQASVMLVLGALASLAGVVLGAVLQEGLAAILAPLVAVALPPPGVLTAARGLVLGMLLLAGFALPGLAALGRVPPLQVLRNGVDEPQSAVTVSLWRWLGGQLRTVTPAVLALGAVAMIGSARPLLAVEALLAIGAVAALAAGFSRLLIAAALGLLPQLPRLWRIGVRSLGRRPGFASLQAGALAVGLLVLLVLGLVRNDLMATWQASVPAAAPDHFILGVQAEERAALSGFMRSEGHPALDFRPLLRARLLAIDGATIDLAKVHDARERALLDREFNLTWADHFNADNVLVAGTPWAQAPAGAGLSLEQDFAERLHLRVGSRLRFDVAGVVVESAVASIRKVKWDSFQPNFFVVARPGVLDGSDVSYLASFHLGPGESALGDRLVARFPQVTLIDIGTALTQVRELTSQVALAVEFVFALALVSGLLVLLAGIQATHDERLREGAVLRALGATRAQLRTLQIVEFGVLGGSAGLSAAVGASIVGYFATTRLLDLAWHPDFIVPIAGTALGLLLVGVTAALALRPLGRAVPAESLRLFG